MTQENVAEPPAEDQPATGRVLDVRLVRAGVIVLVVVALALAWTAVRRHGSTASVPGRGACVYADPAGGKNPKIHDVGCSDPRAHYTVLSRIDGGTQGDCDTVTGADASYAASSHGKPDYVLCLALK